MRILVAHPGPNFSVQDVYVGWIEALRELGETVAEYNLDDRLTFYGSVVVECGEGMFKHPLDDKGAKALAVNGLYSDLYRFRPHVLLAVSSFFLPTELFDLARATGTRVVLLHTESPYEDGRQVEQAAHADLNLVNDPTNLEAFRYYAPTEYMPHAYRPTLHRFVGADPTLAADLAFVGTGYPSRIEFFQGMDLAGLDVLLAGNWQFAPEDSPILKYVAHNIDECLDNAEAVRIYSSAKVGINLYRREAEKAHLAAGWAMGPREIEMAACGMFFLRDPRPESDELFPMLPTFEGPQDASDKVRYWLARPEQRRDLAAQARAAIRDRTFTNNARTLLRLLDNGGKQA